VGNPDCNGFPRPQSRRCTMIATKEFEVLRENSGNIRDSRSLSLSTLGEEQKMFLKNSNLFFKGRVSYTDNTTYRRVPDFHP